MFLHLVGKELRYLSLDRRTLLVSALTLTVVAGAIQLQAISLGRKILLYEERVRIDGPPRSLQDVWNKGVELQRPPNPLSVFALGLEPELGRSATVNPADEPSLGLGEFENPMQRILPAADMVYAISLLGGLLSLLVGYNAVSGERQAGTLRLVLVNAVPRYTFLLAKWTAGCVIVLLPLWGGIIVGAGLAVQTTPGLLGLDAGLRVFSIGCIASLYVAAMVACAVAVSCFHEDTSSSLVLAFTIWVAVVFLVPAGAPVVARILDKAESIGPVLLERERIVRQTWNEDEEIANAIRTKSREDLELYTLQLQRRAMNRARPLMESHARKSERQLDLSVLLSRLSPAGVLVHAASELAGTGTTAFVSRREVLLRYRASLGDFLQSEFEDRARRLGPASSTDEPMGREIPQLLWTKAGSSAVDIPAILVDGTVLILMTLAALFAGYAALMRAQI